MARLLGKLVAPDGYLRIVPNTAPAKFFGRFRGARRFRLVLKYGRFRGHTGNKKVLVPHGLSVPGKGYVRERPAG